MRHAVAVVLSPIILFIMSGGCPQGGSGGGEPRNLKTAASAPASVSKGDTVALRANPTADANLSSVTYEWFQTSGRAVELSGADQAEASFVAPSLPTQARLAFRVDAHTPAGSIVSSAVEVTVRQDPDFGADDSLNDDGGGDDPLPQVRLQTSMGTIVLELDREAAPLTVNNFLRYVDDGFYDDTIFHRVIAEFVVQGGGFEAGLEAKEPRSPIRNEASNGLKNERGTVAMARTNDPDSATSQFFINLEDNDTLDFRSGFDGYAVFGRVVQGMDVVDEIADVDTESRDGFDDVPVEDVVLESATRTSGVIATSRTDR